MKSILWLPSIRVWKWRERKGLCIVCDDESSLFASLKRISGRGEVREGWREKECTHTEKLYFPNVLLYLCPSRKESTGRLRTTGEGSSSGLLWEDLWLVAPGRGCKVRARYELQSRERNSLWSGVYASRLANTKAIVHTYARNPFTSACYRAVQYDRLLNEYGFPFYECWVCATR